LGRFALATVFFFIAIHISSAPAGGRRATGLDVSQTASLRPANER
jgi:hypothetical protein